jgi:GNAT superfamily N-acetyltransferase
MSQYKLIALGRDEYLNSIERLKNDQSIRFANMSLDWWDKQYGWNQQGCFALTDAGNLHLCYIFYKIDRFHDYITIHNIFTPQAQRRHGYAQILLQLIFDLAITKDVKRFRLTSVSTSLDFYLSRGLVYWGVNSVGDFYCELPISEDGLTGLKERIRRLSVMELIDTEFATSTRSKTTICI